MKKRYAIFCEGDTEYNYIDNMRKKQGVELVLKPINMHGGGYSNFLRQIKKESQTNYLAKFIIVGADRIVKVPGEKENFLKLLEYCRIQNEKGNTPLFVIADNTDEEAQELYEEGGLTLLAAREAALTMVHEYESTRDDGDEATVYAIVSKPDDYAQGHYEVLDGDGIANIY